MSSTIDIHYTGHPFVDVGVAVLKCATTVENPESITSDHVSSFLNEIANVYINPLMSNYLGAVIFANVNFANPSMNAKPHFDDVRRSRLLEWLNLYETGEIPDGVELADEDEQCVFSGEQATIRVSRTLIPMIGSESAINFVPMGRPRLPIASWVLLALLVMPMGTVNSGGRVFLVHTHDTDLLEKLVRQNLERNRSDLQAAFQSDWVKKRPNYRFHKTFLLSELNTLRLTESRGTSYPLTVYHFTSSGKASKMDIYHLSSKVVQFIQRAYLEERDAWMQLIQRAWDIGDESKENRSQGQQEYIARNYLYEDLFDLPQNAYSFMRRYFLRRVPRYKTDKTDPRLEYNLIHDRDLISWNLLGIYLEDIMEISKERFDAIKILGEKLARFIELDPRYFNKLYTARGGKDVRLIITQMANRTRQMSAMGEMQQISPLITLDEYALVFMEDHGESLKDDWWFAHDLLLIRIIEQLSPEFIQSNLELLENAETEAQQLKTTKEN